MNCPCEPSKCNGVFLFFFFSPAFNEGEDSYHEEVAYQITVIACVEPARERHGEPGGCSHRERDSTAPTGVRMSPSKVGAGQCP